LLFNDFVCKLLIVIVLHWQGGQCARYPILKDLMVFHPPAGGRAARRGEFVDILKFVFELTLFKHTQAAKGPLHSHASKSAQLGPTNPSLSMGTSKRSAFMASRSSNIPSCQ